MPTHLASHKAVFVHTYRTEQLPQWLGRYARVKDSMDDGYGALDVDYIIPEQPGEAQIASVAWASPGPSSLTILAKEHTIALLSRVSDVWDIDVRVQCTTKPVDDPMNWLQIKRFCHCWPTQARFENETSITAGDGETTQTIPFTSAQRPVLIKPVQPVLIHHPYSALPVVPSVVALRAYGSEQYFSKPDGVDDTADVTNIAAIGHVRLVATTSGVRYSVDQGRTYDQSLGITGLIDTIALSDYSYVLASLGAALYLSMDGGQNFALLAIPSMWSGDVKTIHCINGIFYILLVSGDMYLYEPSLGLQSITPCDDLFVYDFIGCDGLLYLIGYSTSLLDATICIRRASYNGIDKVVWKDVYITNYDRLHYAEFGPNLHLAVSGYGVIYASIFALNDGSISAPHYGLYRTIVLRSVNWGAAGTWEEQYLNYGDNDSIVIPTSLASSQPNSAQAIGWCYTYDNIVFTFADYVTLFLEE